jgi:hypothetical protein
MLPEPLYAKRSEYEPGEPSTKQIEVQSTDRAPKPECRTRQGNRIGSRIQFPISAVSQFCNSDNHSLLILAEHAAQRVANFANRAVAADRMNDVRQQILA